jgi:hypothetical protein
MGHLCQPPAIVEAGFVNRPYHRIDMLLGEQVECAGRIQGLCHDFLNEGIFLRRFCHTSILFYMSKISQILKQDAG